MNAPSPTSCRRQTRRVELIADLRFSLCVSVISRWIGAYLVFKEQAAKIRRSPTDKPWWVTRYDES